MKLKSIFSALGISALLLASSPAYSGLLLMGGGAGLAVGGARSDSTGGRVGFGIGSGLLLTTGIATTGVGIAFMSSIPILGLVVGIPLLILNDESHVENIKYALMKKYPFIEDPYVLDDLANLISHKVSEEEFRSFDGGILLNITKNEMMDILGPTDLFETKREKALLLVEDFSI